MSLASPLPLFASVSSIEVPRYSVGPTGWIADALKGDMDYVAGTGLGEVVNVSCLDLP